MEAIVPPLTYFGNLSYFKEFYKAQEVYIDNKEVYLKQTFRNRTQVLAANGILDLSVPIKGIKGVETSIESIFISYDDPWQTKHWKTIKSAYKSAPFFEEYEDDIKSLILTSALLTAMGFANSRSWVIERLIRSTSLTTI